MGTILTLVFLCKCASLAVAAASTEMEGPGTFVVDFSPLPDVNGNGADAEYEIHLFIEAKDGSTLKTSFKGTRGSGGAEKIRTLVFVCLRLDQWSVKKAGANGLILSGHERSPIIKLTLESERLAKENAPIITRSTRSEE